MSAIINATLPALSVQAYGLSVSQTNSINAVLPALQVKAYGGAVISAVLPSLIASAQGQVPLSASINVTLPSLKASAKGVTGIVCNINVKLTLLASAYGAGVMSATLPSLIVSGAGKTGLTAKINAVLPSLVVMASGKIPNAIIGHINATLPALSANAGRINATLPALVVTATASTVLENLVAYVMNIRTSETTVYGNYGFSSIFRLGTDYYGVKTDGLYLLDGPNDNGTPINAAVRTHETNFGVDNLKRIPFAYLDCETQVNVTPWADGVKKQSYESSCSGHRVKLSRGVQGKWWNFQVDNIKGQEFKLGSIDPLIEVLSRKYP